MTATAADTDGTVASVRFDLPDGTSVTDTTAPFSTTSNSARVADGGGYVIRATATDNQGATATTTVTVTVANGTGGLHQQHVQRDRTAARDPGQQRHRHHVDQRRSPATAPSRRCRCRCNITHTFRGDLVVTLISPGGTQFIVSNRAGGSTDNIVITNQAITDVQRPDRGGHLEAQGPGPREPSTSARSTRGRCDRRATAARTLALVGLGDAEPADDRQRHGVHQPDRRRRPAATVAGPARHLGPPRLPLDPARHAGAQRRHGDGVPDRDVPDRHRHVQLHQPRGARAVPATRPGHGRSASSIPTHSATPACSIPGRFTTDGGRTEPGPRRPGSMAGVEGFVWQVRRAALTGVAAARRDHRVCRLDRHGTSWRSIRR